MNTFIELLHQHKLVFSNITEMASQVGYSKAVILQATTLSKTRHEKATVATSGIQ